MLIKERVEGLFLAVKHYAVVVMLEVELYFGVFAELVRLLRNLVSEDFPMLILDNSLLNGL